MILGLRIFHYFQHSVPIPSTETDAYIRTCAARLTEGAILPVACSDAQDLDDIGKEAGGYLLEDLSGPVTTENLHGGTSVPVDTHAHMYQHMLVHV